MTMKDYVIAHGALQAATWALLVPAGILVARHRWLVELRGLRWAAKIRIPFIAIAMTLATAAMIAGFVIPFETFSEGMVLSEELSIVQAHAVIGILLMSLVGFHAVLGAVRPRGDQLDGKALDLWNWVHGVTGYLTAGLAVSNVYIGIWMYSRKGRRPGMAAWYAPVTASLAVNLIAGVLLEWGKLRWEADAARKQATEDVEAKQSEQVIASKDVAVTKADAQ